MASVRLNIFDFDFNNNNNAYFYSTSPTNPLLMALYDGSVQVKISEITG